MNSHLGDRPIHDSVNPSSTSTMMQLLFSSTALAPRRQFSVRSILFGARLIIMTVVVIGAASLRPDFAIAQSRPALVQEGYSLLDRGWVGDAIVQFQQAVQRYPDSVEAQLGLAIAYQRNGQDADAWQAYQQVLQIDATNPTALAAIGLLGGYRPEWQVEGINALTTLLDQTPNNTSARARRALLYGYQGRFVEAIADYEIVLAENPAPEVILNAAQIYTYSGSYAEGLSLFDAYRATGAAIPDSALAAYATTLRETGEVETAIQLLETRLQSPIATDQVEIDLRTALAIAHQRNGNPEQAIRVLDPLRNRGDATLALARALSTIGRQANDPTLIVESIEYYQRALAEMPTPSVGLRIEVADVLSEYAPTRSEALDIYQALMSEGEGDRSLLVKALVVAYELGRISRNDLGRELTETLRPLPASSAEQRAIALALLRLDPPVVSLTPIYEQLANAELDVPFLEIRLAQLAIEANDFAAARDAIARYRTSVVGADDLTPELLLAEIERREGNLEASAQRYQTLIAQQPERDLWKGAMRGLAGIRIAQNQLDEAWNLYAQILSVDPSDLPSQLGQASVGYQLQTLSEAEAEMAIAAWFDAESMAAPPPELFNLAGALPATPERLALYNQLLATNPHDFGVNRRWLEVMAVQDPDQAQARVTELVEQNPDRAEVYFIQGEFAQRQGDLELASQSYSIVLDREPDNVDAISALAGVRFQQRRYDEARQLYTQALEFDPNDIDIRMALAELSAAEGQSLSAWQQFNAIRLDQQESGVDDRAIRDRQQQIEVNMLRQRGFQPSWERY